MRTLFGWSLLLGSFGLCSSACQEIKICYQCGPSNACDDFRGEGETCLFDADCYDFTCQDGKCIRVDTYQWGIDFDGDGIEDEFDNCPWVNNRDQADGDGDFWGDECDNCPGMTNENQQDTDHDGSGDLCDQDPDGDGWSWDQDNCPDAANPQQVDTDDDGDGDFCDPDIDGDGFLNPDDNCPYKSNPDQEILDPVICEHDRDRDGVLDYSDNCPFDENPDQLNSDDDPLGDACDWDRDNDRLANDEDTCPLDPNPLPKDEDGDGIFDACDDWVCYRTDVPEVCIDPDDQTTLHAGADRTVEVGECVPLFVWSNAVCEGWTIATWTLLSWPSGSKAEVHDPVAQTWYVVRGRVHLYDEIYPSIIPDVHGDYRLSLEVRPDNQGLCTDYVPLTDELVITAR